MATKHKLIKDFQGQKEGDTVIIVNSKLDYFIEEGFIAKPKNTKTKAKKVVVKPSEEKINK